ncbi:DUF6446 family protein [Cypionkella sinensis]|uniref:DUF6446 family protein n=1 Tax=Cypionkella sinensis TaxID=1756043 RepID=A0ABV7J4L0_9RHOB
MNGKYVAGFIVIVAALAGLAMYLKLQEDTNYVPASFQKGAEIALTLIESGQPEPILVDQIEGITAEASPLGYRACFHTPLSQAMLTETYKIYDKPTPLIAPKWFDCFDADAIGEALEKGEAIAFLSEANVTHAKPSDPVIDRVVAVFPDGHAFAWHQISPVAEP